jgi:hypothetical protein
MRRPDDGGFRALAEARQRAERGLVEDRCSPHQAADIARCSVETIIHAARRRELPCSYTPSGKRLLEPEAVRQWARERKLLLN